MAKKFVRGITDIKEINKQDFDTNNVNDLLSDGEHNYIHRKKKDNSEEYHNLTNNLKTITSDDTDLISVTNYNNSTNTATLHPKHDAQKEQTLESERNTITIEHGTNATTETTKVDTNPEIVLEHANLKTGDGLSVFHEGETSSITISPTKKSPSTNLNNQLSSLIYGSQLKGRPTEGDYVTTGYITIQISDNQRIQFSVKPSTNSPSLVIMFYRFVNADNTATEWRQMAIDSNELTSLLSQKQNTLVSSTSIGVLSNNTLKQVYYYKKTYTDTNGSLTTHAKSIAQNTNINANEHEYNFIVKINKNVASVDFTLNESDTKDFNTIITKYGENNTVCISGCVFTLDGSTLTVSTANNTEQNHVITFSDII
jgi:hypothetical protein